MPKLNARSAAPPAAIAGLALWFGFLDRTHALSPELKAAATLALLIWFVARWPAPA